uniref:Type II secretory pathway ATPase GspE/PulE or T4P pilus assembly pathway ATPase PilB n=1 Tax=Candidatus Kentrum sp. FM TaxID=2126340 RepID=A0A450TVW3_9GAMM|nr:MAG: Type II secretory pathway ATPase GspE/PulE or T4P pilus assembly pathway ATPase PilB [Candidatus Kentron sp. FM]VFJ73038.1 MAG: Type II secretory pathway ATPase GspE/PulE or T4P pilus assembly pathway ATPase PilB [Candidatus Kentron sp. FM]VFK07483.1 MAG: Type II secretory pathway ATPase GspE/PulE or T4P pilus assembly pathway ATPase PilB [Candidatus Kentron sp. FM]
MPNTDSAQTADQRLNALTHRWGWRRPNEAVLKAARTALLAQGKDLLPAAIALGYTTLEEFDTWRKNMPEEIRRTDDPRQIDDWLAEHMEGIRSHRQRIDTWRNGYQYFDSLSPATLHPAMSEQADIHDYCQRGACLLCQIEKQRNLLIFSEFETLWAFGRMGREERLSDPIRQRFGKGLVLACGEPALIRNQLNKSGDTIDVTAVEGNDVFHAMRAKTEAQQILARILENAAAQETTDVGIVPQEDGSGRVYFRENQDLAVPGKGVTTLTRDDLGEITRFLTSVSGANPDSVRTRDPKDGQFTFRDGKQEIFLRCSFIPLVPPGLDQERISISLRLLPKKRGLLLLKDLNIDSQVEEEIINVLSYSQGLIVLAGATNSGKSTTITAFMGEHLKRYGIAKKRISLEDPIERNIEGIIQINAASEAFPRYMRALLRHDPDVIWVGEIRDEDTAEICVKAAISGHLVLSTVHATDTVMAYRAIASRVDASRLFDLSESLAMLIGQRLVKTVCPHCSEKRPPSQREIDDIAFYLRMEGIAGDALPEEVVEANPHGCEHCKRGYRGLAPVNEILPASRQVKALLSAAVPDHKEIGKHRTITMFESAMRLVRAGRIEVSGIPR